jgi:[acyl-carrier-protein] S-malonyltransferase
MLALLQGESASAVLAAAAQVTGVDFRAAVKDGRDIYANRFAQPLICAAQLAAWSELSPLLPAPSVFAGYSVGELAAYGCAGALSASDTIRLAQRRADLMDSASPSESGLLAVQGLRRDTVRELCDRHRSHIAIVNGSDHFVIGGVKPDLEHAATDASERGARTVQLRVTVPAHTPLLAEAVSRFESALRASPLRAPSVPIVAGINPIFVRERETAIEILSKQLSQKIEWSRCVEAMLETGVSVLLELGPGCALARMAREVHPDLPVRSLAEFRSFDGVVAWVRKNSSC